MATTVQENTAAQRIDVFAALRRHWFLALVPVVLFTAAAVTIGLKRAVRYTTTANLSVGHVYVSDPSGIPTIIEATQSLAAVYSRAIYSSAVAEDTRLRLGRRSSSVSGTLSATPIPSSPLIKVRAESSSADGAVALANAGATALAKYTNRQVRDNNASTSLADSYRQAALAYRRRVDTEKGLGRRYSLNPTRSNRRARDAAGAASDTALLRRDALRASYVNAVRGGTSSVAVEVFSPAGTPQSDRSRVLQILVFVGLLGGLAVGAALALLRAARQMRGREVR